MAPQLKTAIDNLIQSNKVVVFIKVRRCWCTALKQAESPTAGKEGACGRLLLLDINQSSR